VAGGALALVLALRKLPLVCVLVAIHALRKWKWLLEISLRMTLDALHLRVFSEQRKPRLRMVKLLAFGNPLPTGGGVASLAGLRERSAMRIGMTIAAFRKWNSLVAWLSTGRRRCMTFRARRLRVEPGERISRLVVIEFLGCFPVHKIVALETVLAQLTFMRILMACHTVWRKAQKRPVQVIHLDLRALRWSYVRRRMTLVALDPGVFPFQWIACSIVVKSLE